jgi:type I restriction enzyme S subunit
MMTSQQYQTEKLEANWTSYPFHELIDFKEGPGILAKDFRTVGVPLIRLAGLERGGSVLTGCNYLDPEMVHQRWWNFRLQEGDILLSTSASLGRIAVVTAEAVGAIPYTGIIRMRPKDNRVFAPFIRYLLAGRHFQAQVEKMGVGSVIRHFGPFHLRQMTVSLPPLPTQRKIAAILSAYDDLIEDNTRRIRILEDMAQMIYREWFVNFRFPGHEKVKIVESELGMIPEGWKVRNLFDVAKVNYGFPFKSKLFTQDPVGEPVIRIRDILSNETKTFTSEVAKEKYLVRNGAILVGMDGDFHMTKWAGGEAYLNQRVVSLHSPQDICAYYLFLALQQPIANFNTTIVGTTVAHLSDEDLRSINLLVPDKEIAERCWPILDSMFNLEITLRSKNASLRRTRDLLLPRLISGEIDVENLDIDMEGLA